MNLLYILFNKPYRVLSQFTPVEGKKTLADFHFPKHIYSVGRLDYESEGLLLLTNDNAVKYRLEHPQFFHPRTYLVQTEHIPNEYALNILRNGISIRTNNSRQQYFTTLPAEVELLKSEPPLFPRSVPIRLRKTIPTSWLQIILREGKNHQIRKMTAAIGCPTLRLVRIAIDILSIEHLLPGEWKFVSSNQIQRLKQSLETSRNARK
ncbi:MAG: pseudouridine synthase [Ignavibacteria bacterium]|nr:pseudouridine synthase [Ignavibacteria bacterium]